MAKLSENLTLLSEELSTAKKSLQKKSDLPPIQAKKEKSKITEPTNKFTSELCSSFEQKLAIAEKLCDALQTDNEVCN